MRNPLDIRNELIQILGLAEKTQRMAFAEATGNTTHRPPPSCFFACVRNFASESMVYSFGILETIAFLVMGICHRQIKGWNNSTITLFSLAGVMGLYTCVGAAWNLYERYRLSRDRNPVLIEPEILDIESATPEQRSQESQRRQIIRGEKECTPLELTALYDSLVKKIKGDRENLYRTHSIYQGNNWKKDWKECSLTCIAPLFVIIIVTYILKQLVLADVLLACNMAALSLFLSGWIYYPSRIKRLEQELTRVDELFKQTDSLQQNLRLALNAPEAIAAATRDWQTRPRTPPTPPRSFILELADSTPGIALG